MNPPQFRNQRVWQGNGDPLEMWLLQLDLAGHSKWTRELKSYPDAFQLRKDFAINRLLNYG